jgi:hypothetical protein
MKYASAIIELAGLAAISLGAYMLAPWLGVAVGGALAVVVGQAVGGKPT